MTQRQRYEEYVENCNEETCMTYDEWYEWDCKLAEEEDWQDYYADRDERDEWDDYWDDVARSVGATPFLW